MTERREFEMRVVDKLAPCKYRTAYFALGYMECALLWRIWGHSFSPFYYSSRKYRVKANQCFNCKVRCVDEVQKS